MSGGEQQRVAIARALIMQPRYIFADEPTGNLDTRNADIVMQILKRTNKELGTTIALVTHEPDFAAQADREIYLIDGRLADRNRDR
ncbi:MAG: ATP-binding cassette domain-containing protein [Bdellovibrio sp.]|nr:ATP-binding cassette domain-containing protein [Bdellovibrio sp.]